MPRANKTSKIYVNCTVKPGEYNKTLVILKLVNSEHATSAHAIGLCPRECNPLSWRFGLYGGCIFEEIKQRLLDVCNAMEQTVTDQLKLEYDIRVLS